MFLKPSSFVFFIIITIFKRKILSLCYLENEFLSKIHLENYTIFFWDSINKNEINLYGNSNRISQEKFIVIGDKIQNFEIKVFYFSYFFKNKLDMG